MRLSINWGWLTTLLFSVFLLTYGHASARHFKDTVHFRKPLTANKQLVMSDSTLEAIGVDSLLDKVEQVQNTLNNIINTTSLGFDTKEIEEGDAEIDSNIDLIEQNLKIYTNVLDLKNLQMFQVVLNTLLKQVVDWREQLNGYDKQLLTMGSELTSFRNDTLLNEIMDDTVFTNEYATEIQDIKTKITLAKKSVAENQANQKKWIVGVNNQYFEILDLQNGIKGLLHKATTKALNKEYAYLWEATNTINFDKSVPGHMAADSFHGQKKILRSCQEITCSYIGFVL